MRGTHGSAKTEAMLRQHHNHEVSGSQCSSSLTQTIDAPMGLVWSMVRDFGHPQAYKRFVRRCIMRSGNGGRGGVGSVREVHVVSGMPAGVSVERLERLDDDAKVMSFSIIGGDHRLENYQSTTSVHEDEDDHDDDDEGERGKRTVVIESYVVDVPEGSSEEDTCAFANTIIRCNLMSLATIAEKMAAGS